jgi:tetratricopeptide (TPR) repeat protein
VPGVRLLTLRGLAATDVLHLVRALTGDAVAARIGERVCAETDGNPFFVEHLARHLVERGADGPEAGGVATAGLPEGVRSVLQVRIDRLSDDCRQTLAIAAVIGREFELSLLSALRADERGESRAAALDGTLGALEEAIRARMVEQAGSTGRRHRFAHAMLREAFYRGLGVGERSRRHRRVAEELERGAGGDERFLSEMADHFVLGVASGAPEQAVRYTIGAGRAANARFAFEAAAERFAQALAMLPFDDAAHDPERIDLLIAIAEAHWNAGDPARSRGAAERAAELARKTGDATLFARAALACELTSAQRPAPGNGITSAVDVRYVQFLEEALAGLPETDSELRARLLARLGWASYFARDHGERRERATREALAMARRLGDFATLFTTLMERHQALMDPAHAHERLSLAHEMIWLAESEGSRQALAIAYGLRAWDTAESGAMRAADADMAVCGRLADEVHQPVLRCRFLLWQAMRAIVEGRWNAATRLAHEGFALGRTLDEDLATLNLGNQLLTMQVMIGTIDGLEMQVGMAVARYPGLPALRAALAHIHALRGDVAAAREALDACLAGGLDALPWDSTWLVTLGLLALACVRVGDRERAAELHAALLPYRHQNVILGVNALACFGPTTRALGNLATVLERWDDANVHFEEAIAAQRAMHARPWLAYTCLEHAHALARRGRDADRALLQARLEEALRHARELGMPLVEREATALAAAVGVGAPAPATR